MAAFCTYWSAKMENNMDTKISQKLIQTRMASEVFKIAGRVPTQNELQIFSRLFANPLCEIMFLARKRVFSDYQEDTPELLSQAHACKLIEHILNLESEESRVEFFFDQMREIKPSPLSQRDTIEYQYGTTESFMALMVQPCLREYLQKHQGTELNKIHDALRYEIASEIEKNDLCCSRTYRQLMNEIKNYLREVLYKDEAPSFFSAKRERVEDEAYAEQRPKGPRLS